MERVVCSWLLHHLLQASVALALFRVNNSYLASAGLLKHCESMTCLRCDYTRSISQHCDYPVVFGIPASSKIWQCHWKFLVAHAKKHSLIVVGRHGHDLESWFKEYPKDL